MLTTIIQCWSPSTEIVFSPSNLHSIASVSFVKWLVWHIACILQYFTTITKPLLWQTIGSVWKGSSVVVSITMLFVLSPGWSSGTEQTLQNTQAVDSCWQVVWEETRLLWGFTICIVQQHNAIYQHFSYLLGIKGFNGALIPFSVFLFKFIFDDSAFSS